MTYKYNTRVKGVSDVVGTVLLLLMSLAWVGTAYMYASGMLSRKLLRNETLGCSEYVGLYLNGQSSTLTVNVNEEIVPTVELTEGGTCEGKLIELKDSKGCSGDTIKEGNQLNPNPNNIQCTVSGSNCNFETTFYWSEPKTNLGYYACLDGNVLSNLVMLNVVGPSTTTTTSTSTTTIKQPVTTTTTTVTITTTQPIATTTSTTTSSTTTTTTTSTSTTTTTTLPTCHEKCKVTNPSYASGVCASSRPDANCNNWKCGGGDDPNNAYCRYGYDLVTGTSCGVDENCYCHYCSQCGASLGECNSRCTQSGCGTTTTSSTSTITTTTTLPACDGTDTSCGIYPDCVNCNDQDDPKDCNGNSLCLKDYYCSGTSCLYQWMNCDSCLDNDYMIDDNSWRDYTECTELSGENNDYCNYIDRTCSNNGCINPNKFPGDAGTSACYSECSEADVDGDETTETCVGGYWHGADCSGSSCSDVLEDHHPCSDTLACCPTGCNANNDNDCSATCGNGIVEPGEDCDTTSPLYKCGSEIGKGSDGHEWKCDSTTTNCKYQDRGCKQGCSGFCSNCALLDLDCQPPSPQCKRDLTGSCGRSSYRYDGTCSNQEICQSEYCKSINPSIQSITPPSESYTLGDTVNTLVQYSTSGSYSGSWSFLIECRLIDPNGCKIDVDKWSSASSGQIKTETLSYTTDIVGEWTLDYCLVYTDFTNNEGWGVVQDRNDKFYVLSPATTTTTSTTTVTTTTLPTTTTTQLTTTVSTTTTTIPATTTTTASTTTQPTTTTAPTTTTTPYLVKFNCYNCKTVGSTCRCHITGCMLGAFVAEGTPPEVIGDLIFDIFIFDDYTSTYTNRFELKDEGLLQVGMVCIDPEEVQMMEYEVKSSVTTTTLTSTTTVPPTTTQLTTTVPTTTSTSTTTVPPTTTQLTTTVPTTTTTLPTCPSDSPCTSYWPSHQGPLINTGNENSYSCDIYEVCHPDLEWIAQEAIDCCNDCSLPQCHGKCNVARNDAGLNTGVTPEKLKKCEGLYIILGFGPEAKFMLDYFWPEICCLGNYYCIEGCSFSDFGHCSCSGYTYNQNAENLPCTSGYVATSPKAWKDNTDMSKNTCLFSDLQAHVSIDIIHTGTCCDYSSALTTMLRIVGYAKNEVYSISGPGHCFNMILFPGETKWNILDTTGNFIIPYTLSGLPGSTYADYCNYNTCRNDAGIFTCPNKNEVKGC